MIVVIRNWKPGFNKVQFNKLLQEYADCTLSEAKVKVDNLLEGKELYVDVEQTKLEEFSALAQKLGAVLESDSKRSL